MPALKIVYVVTRSDEIGGAQIHVRDMAEAAAATGHDVVVFAGGSGLLFDQLARTGIAYARVPALVRPIRPLKDLRALVGLTWMLRRERPDLVSLHSSKAGLLGRVAATAARVPAVFTAHGWAFTEGTLRLPRAVFRVLERWASPLARRIITVSEYDRALALEARLHSARTLVTVHNGMPDVGADLRAAPACDSPVRLAMVARFSAQKDHETLLRALARMQPRAEWVVELIGAGPRMEAVAGLAAELGLDANIVFAGEVDDVARRLACAQVYVLASRWEGLPRSIIEAMRAGMPVVASNVGGVKELVAHGDNGFLVDAHDDRSLGARLTEMVDDPELRRRMGRRGRERYERSFRFDDMVDKTFAVYEAVARPQEGGSG